VAKRLAGVGKPRSLINISSQIAHLAGIDRALYAATKHAVEGFAKSRVIEWGPKQTRVSTIFPTFILTKLAQKVFDWPDRRP
jgi:NAD(P)-dependent dehydrogenase (short-subunit alcohol dehydrogenase family)